MQVCTLLQTDNHTSTSLLSFLQAGCPSCCPTNSVEALKAQALKAHTKEYKTLQKNKQLFNIQLSVFWAFAFSALKLLEGHPACKKLEWWVAGMVICLE